MKTTVNLLPPHKKQAMQSAFVFAYVQSLLMVVFVLTCIVSATLLSVRLLLMSTLNGLSSKSGPDTEEFTEVSQEINDINAYIEHMNDITSKRVAWSVVLDELVAILPENAMLDRINVTREGKIFLTGNALHREDVLELDRRLVGSEMFIDIKSPLSNILQRDNVAFEFEMQYAALAAEPEEISTP